jgi:hypothetical protein
MNKTIRVLLIAVVLFCATQYAMADKGIGKKSKNRITLNISTQSTLRNSLSLNLKNGLRYSGSVTRSTQTQNNSVFKTTTVTYQKGNTVYIIPYKQKIVVPEIKQGYTGMKLIIKPGNN